MFYVPDFDAGLVHWLCLILLLIAPVMFAVEATGHGFGYSKFADRSKRWSLPSRLGMLLCYLPATFLFWLPTGLGAVPLSGWHFWFGLLFSAHFIKRCLEVLLLHRYSGVMNVISVGLTTGLYSIAALLLGEVAATEVGHGGMPTSGFEGWMLVGTLLWLVGIGTNFYHHWLLAGLRTPGDREYRVPRGGLFRWVACPHYLGEILAWWGLAFVFHHAAGIIAALFCTLYLAGRAHLTLQWYRQHLGDELPTSWKRLLPLGY